MFNLLGGGGGDAVPAVPSPAKGAKEPGKGASRPTGKDSGKGGMSREDGGEVALSPAAQDLQGRLRKWYDF